MITKVGNLNIKPYVKWAGGKGQLISTFENYYPTELISGKIKRYIEPFVGGGAVLFDVLQKYNIEEAVIFDINSDLINAYTVIKKDVYSLIDNLSEIENQYLRLDINARKVFYYRIREEYNIAVGKFNINNHSERNIERASQFIFLNRTCFNGLYRVNRTGLFNVPMGDYKNPTLCDADNLLAISGILQNVEIFNSDYRDCINYIDKNSFVYFDPPYRPLNTTSSFTSYSKFDFNDKDQIDLANFFSRSDATGAFLMLSNSDPKNVDISDTFFDKLYENFNIHSIKAKRMINSKADKRGDISEILVTNYKKR